MRKSTYVIIALILVNIAVSAVFLAILPPEIPTKFDFQGNVLNTGSKTTQMVMPVTVLLCGITTAVTCEKRGAASEKEKRQAGLISVAGLLLLTVINIGTLVWTYSLC